MFTKRENSFQLEPFNVALFKLKFFNTMFSYLKFNGSFYYTLKCQIEYNVFHRNIWLRRLVKWYRLPINIRYIYAFYCLYTNKWHLIQYDVGFKVFIEIVCNQISVVVCFFLLHNFSLCLAWLLTFVNWSPNGQYMHELVVMNVNDFIANNQLIFNSKYPFFTWPIQLYWKFFKNPNLLAVGQNVQSIKLKLKFRYFHLLNHQKRIFVLMLISVCEIFSGVVQLLFGKRYLYSYFTENYKTFFFVGMCSIRVCKLVDELVCGFLNVSQTILHLVNHHNCQ